MLIGTPLMGNDLIALLFDQISSPPPLLSLEGMQNGLGGLVMLGIPQAGTMMQNEHLIPQPLLQVMVQRLGKESMIAIPLPLTIQGHDKEIGLLKPLQHLLAVRLLNDGITERATQLLQDAGA